MQVRAGGRARAGAVFSRRPAVALAALAALALVLRSSLLAGGQIDYDEGVYWQSLRALAAGHPLFISVYSSQPPAFLMFLLPAHAELGGSIAADRAVVAVLTVAGLVGVYRTASSLGAPAAGLVAAAVLAADPLYLRQSVTLQADGPAVALALAALALGAEVRARAGGGRAWLAAAAGAVLGLAVLTKLLAVAAAPALVAVLAAPLPGRCPGWRPAGAALSAALAGGATAAAAVLLPFAGVWPLLWEQSVGLHLGAQAVDIGGLDTATLLRGLPVAALGAVGFALALRRAPLLAVAGGAWTVAGALLLAAHRPIWPHHAVIVVAPLALLAGGIALSLERLPSRASGAAAAAAAVLAVAGALGSLAYVRTLQVPDARRQAAVDALRAATAPGDSVVTDDQYTVALADRSTPPELVDTSQLRVLSGDLTAPRAEAAAERSGARAVLLATDRLSSLPGFEAWVAERFPARRDLGGGWVIYVRGAESAAVAADSQRPPRGQPGSRSTDLLV